MKQENQELATQLTVEERARRSVEAGLKSAQDQAEDQRKKLYLTEIELATQKQLVLDLKATAWTTEEVTEASRLESYKQGVHETKVRLADELAEVCRDYCKEVWLKALNLAEVPTDSEWREVWNIYYPPDIREVPADLLSSPCSCTTLNRAAPYHRGPSSPS